MQDYSQTHAQAHFSALMAAYNGATLACIPKDEKFKILRGFFND